MALTKINTGGIAALAVDTAELAAEAVTLAKQEVIQAWVNFNGTGTVAIRDSYNVSSITDNGTGDYTVNFTNAMANTNYLSIGMAGNSSTSQQVVSQQQAHVGPATGSCRYQTTYANGSTEDTPFVGIAILGD
jgi:hypothetical protein